MTRRRISTAASDLHAFPHVSRRRWLQAMAGSVGAMALPGGAAWGRDADKAGAWPTRSLTWTVPFPPGGPTDAMSRVVADGVAKRLGQTVIIENKPGVGGSLGTQQFIRTAPADGHSLLFVTAGTLGSNLALHKSIEYDPIRDLAPVHGMFIQPAILLVSSDSPFHSVADILSHSRSRELMFGSGGPGSGAHLSGELFKKESGARMTHVPYKGTAAALQDLMGGRLDLMFDYGITMLPHINSGRLRALAVMSNKRLGVLPNVPAIAEAGFPAAEAMGWGGVAAPAGTPPAIVARLSEAVQQVLQDPEVTTPFIAAGSLPMLEYSEARFKAFVASENRKWLDMAVSSGAAQG